MGRIKERLRKVQFLQILRHPYTYIAKKNEQRKCQRELKKLKNQTPTLFSNDCIAGVLMKNYQLPCKSPMINCAMYPDDYVQYLENIEHYMKCELVEKESELLFPVGELVSEMGNIEIRFQHYSSFKEAQSLWKRRTKRVDLNNMNVILDLNPYMVASKETIEKFLKLPYNKVIITTDAYRKTICSHYINLGKRMMVKGIMLKYKNIRGYRYYDDFDFIGWLNNNAKV